MRPISNEEFNKIKKALETCPKLRTYIDKRLVESFFKTKNRLNQHPLFWFLYEDGNAEKLLKNLEILETKCEKYKTILKKIHSKDQIGFHSSMSEVDVLAFYYSKISDDFQVEYEPEIKDKGTKVEALITANKKEYYLEVFTIFPDENFQKLDAMLLKIREKLDALEKNPYIIITTLFESFDENDIDYLVSEVDKTIRENIANDQNSTNFVDEKTISKDEIDIGEVRLYLSKKDKKGFSGAIMPPLQKVEDAGRIKQKVLTKIDQLPSQGRNIVVVNLSNIMGDKFYDMDDAFLGQKTVFVNKATLEGTEGRHTNGIVHHEKGEYISAIIAYINNDYSTRRYYINDLTAIEQLNKEEWKLF